MPAPTLISPVYFISGLEKRVSAKLKGLGLSYGDVSFLVGLSRQRIAQILGPDENQRATLLKKSKGCCQDCGVKSSKLQAHHIDYRQQVILMLCPKCHRRADVQAGRVRHYGSREQIASLAQSHAELFAQAALLKGLHSNKAPSLNNQIATEFQRERTVRDLTLRQIAKYFGVSYASVCSWERGQHAPSDEHLFALLESEVDWVRQLGFRCIEARYPILVKAIIAFADSQCQLPS